MTTPTRHDVPLEAWLPGALWAVQDVLRERQSQIRQYGLNEDLQDGTGPNTRWLGPFTGLSATDVEKDLRADYEDFEEEVGQVTWVHLLREELAEVVCEDDPEALYGEVLQLTALGLSWLEKLNSRIIRNTNNDKD